MLAIVLLTRGHITAVLYSLGSGSWLAWASGTVAHCEVSHYLW